MFRALALTALLTTPALADEVWYTDLGDVVYETDSEGAAILSFDNFDGSRARLVIPGLAGNYSDRGVHPAFWVGEGAGDCLAGMSLDSPASHQWGEAVVSFDGPAFPTSFTLTLGDCFGPLTRSIRATAR